jgi:transposase InsO family protein
MCDALAVGISGCRAWKRGGKPDRTRLTDPQAVALMKSIHAEVKATYGSRRLHRVLHDRGHCIGLRRVERLIMTGSMSRKGNCRDNAPTASFFNSLKNERVHGTTHPTLADAQADLVEHIEAFYNRSRRHATPG